MSPTLAIDFGSSSTKVAYLSPDGGKPELIPLGQAIREIMPSVFYIPQSGSVLVGDDATQMADQDPAGIVTDIKRHLQRPGKIRCGEGRPVFQRWELVSKLFSEIRCRCDEEVFHNGSVDHCMLTVPVCFSEPYRQKLQQAAEHAGFTSVRLMDEPDAAARHWLSSSGKGLSDHVIVVDIGGGTTDLAAMKLCGGTYESIPDLPPFGFASGGNDIDEDMRKVVAKDFEGNEDETEALLLKLRQVKELLSKTDRDIFSISLAGRTQTIPRNVVELAVRTLVEKTCSEAAKFLKDFEDVTGRKDTPVLLAGGGSKLDGMKEAMEEVAGDRVHIWIDGQYAIALGAALAGGTNGATSTARATSRPETELLPVSTPDENSSALLAKLEFILFNEWDLTKARQQVSTEMVRACELRAKQGQARAQAMLGICYSNEGNPVAMDLDEAAKWFRLSADQEDAYGEFGLASCYRDGSGVQQNHAVAVKWFKLSADQGNAFGQACLGMCYQSGTGVPQNHEEAVINFRLSADQGNALGQVCLGDCYLGGAGISQNYEEAVKWLRLSAEQGYAMGQINLGLCYINGTGVPQKPTEAVKWFRLSADQGNTLGQNLLGTSYYSGEGVPQNYTEAIKWYRLSADQGNAEGQRFLGLLYAEGKGVTQNPAEAVKWFRLSADQGNAEAQVLLGTCYSNGIGVPQNQEEAARWFRLSADQGNADAQKNLGICYFSGCGVLQNHEEAVKWFRLSAEQGDADGQFYLGAQYRDGTGVPTDQTEAIRLFRLSAEQGNAVAQTQLGISYLNGTGIAKNLEKAVKWFRLSADQGNAAGQNFLGCRYLNGTGVPIDNAEAARLFQLSADQKSDWGQYNLGLCYMNGWGVPQSQAEAVKWFRLSADQGNALAQVNLGNCYFGGTGVAQNYEQAAKWYRLSADQRNADAQASLGYLFMTGKGVPVDLSKAEKLLISADWQGNMPAKEHLKTLEATKSQSGQRPTGKQNAQQQKTNQKWCSNCSRFVDPETFSKTNEHNLLKGAAIVGGCALAAFTVNPAAAVAGFMAAKQIKKNVVSATRCPICKNEVLS